MTISSRLYEGEQDFQILLDLMNKVLPVGWAYVDDFNNLRWGLEKPYTEARVSNTKISPLAR